MQSLQGPHKQKPPQAQTSDKQRPLQTSKDLCKSSPLQAKSFANKGHCRTWHFSESTIIILVMIQYLVNNTLIIPWLYLQTLCCDITLNYLESTLFLWTNYYLPNCQNWLPLFTHCRFLLPSIMALPPDSQVILGSADTYLLYSYFLPLPLILSNMWFNNKEYCKPKYHIPSRICI